MAVQLILVKTEGTGIEWIMTNVSYDSISKDVNSESSIPHGLFFKGDGTKMYVGGNGAVFQYTLSTAWDASSATYDTVSKSVTGEASDLADLFFTSDGTRMFVVSAIDATVYSYTLSTPWLVSSASYDSKSYSVSTQETDPNGLFFSTDGTKMFVCGTTSDRVYRYELSTAWDLSSAGHLGENISTAFESSSRCISFRSSGTQMLVGGLSDNVRSYTLPTPWSLSGATNDGIGATKSVSGQEGSMSGIFVSESAQKMYIVGFVNDTVFQYSL